MTEYNTDDRIESAALVGLALEQLNIEQALLDAPEEQIIRPHI